MSKKIHVHHTITTKKNHKSGNVTTRVNKENSLKHQISNDVRAVFTNLWSENHIIKPTSLAEDILLDYHTSLKDAITDFDEFNILWASSDPNVVPTSKAFVSRNRWIDIESGRIMGRVDVTKPCYMDLTYNAKVLMQNDTLTNIDIPMDYIDTLSVFYDNKDYVYQLWRSKTSSDLKLQSYWYSTSAGYWNAGPSGMPSSSSGTNIGYMTQACLPFMANDIREGYVYLFTHHVDRSDNQSTTRFQGYRCSYQFDRITTTETGAAPNKVSTPIALRGYTESGRVNAYATRRNYMNGHALETGLLVSSQANMEVTKKDGPFSESMAVTKDNFFSYIHDWPHSRKSITANSNTIIAHYPDTRRVNDSISNDISRSAMSAALHNNSKLQTTYFESDVQLIGYYINGENTHLILTATIDNEPYVFVSMAHISKDNPNNLAKFDKIREPDISLMPVVKVPFSPAYAQFTNKGVLVSRPLSDNSNMQTVFISFDTLGANRTVWAYNQRARRVLRSGQFRDSHPYDILPADIKTDSSGRHYFEVENSLIDSRCRVQVYVRKDLNMDYEKIESMGINPIVDELNGKVRVYVANKETVRNLTVDLEINF